MKEELEKQIYEIAPVFFEEATACLNNKMNESSTCMAFGCECGDGWFEPIKRLAYKVSIINANAKKYNIKFVCNQLKEKFGEFRLYYSSQMIDKTKITNENIPAINALNSLLDDAIQTCEKECSHVCEFCGKDGGFNGSDLVKTSGWINIICKECAFKQNKSNVISRFDGAYAMLNLYYNHHFFNYKDVFYRSIPHAFFSIIDPKHADIYQEISNLNETSLYTAYTIRKIAKEFGFDFTEENLDLLKDIVRTKFNHHNYISISKALLETNNKMLINENNYHDNFLGHCICSECKDKPYFNYYGKILMEIRDEFRKNISIKMYNYENAVNYVNDIEEFTGIKLNILKNDSDLPNYIITNNEIKE